MIQSAIGRWLAGAAIASIATTGAAVAQDQKSTGWFNSTEFSFVATDGNSRTDSLGMKNTLTRKWDRSNLRLLFDAVRANTTDDPYLLVEPGITFLPGESPTGFAVFQVDPPKELDVEKYFTEGTYTRNISDTRVWSTGASWDRNEDAGILNRFIAFGTLGNLWKDGEKLQVSTNYGLSFTDREEETPDPEKEDQFWGFRASSDVEYRVLESTTLGFRFTGNLNLEDTADYSIDTTGSLGVSMSKRLALKLSLQFLYNSEPALEDADIVARVDLIDPDGTPGSGDEFFVTVTDGGAEFEIGEDQIRKKELDTVFRSSLVINF